MFETREFGSTAISEMIDLCDSPAFVIDAISQSFLYYNEAACNIIEDISYGKLFFRGLCGFGKACKNCPLNITNFDEDSEIVFDLDNPSCKGNEASIIRTYWNDTPAFILILKKKFEKNFRSPLSSFTQKNIEKYGYNTALGHELRTPLNTIIGSAELILMNSSDPEITDHSKDILTSARAAQKLIDDLFAQINTDDASDQPDNFHEASDVISTSSGITTLVTAPETKILIVDDNELNLRVEAKILRVFDVKCDTALGADEAITLVRKTKYDIIFMDHLMPGTDGIECTKMIRELSDVPGFDDKYFKDLIIVAVSASGLKNAKEYYCSQGFSDFILKPVNVKSVQRLLNYWVPSEKLHFRKDTHKEQIKNAELHFDNIDYKSAMVEIGCDEEGYIEILDVFYETGEEKISDIKETCATRNYKDYTIHVHALKSSSASIGARELCSLSKQLESCGKKAQAGDRAAINDIEKVTPLLIVTYESILDEIAPVLIERKSKNNTLANGSAPALVIDLGESESNNNEVIDTLKAIMNAYKEMDYDIGEELIAKLKTLHPDNRNAASFIDRGIYQATKLFDYEKAVVEFDKAIGYIGM